MSRFGWVLAIAMLASCGPAADTPVELDPAASELVFQANRAIDAQRYDAAIAALHELDSRFPGLPESAQTWGRVFFGTGQLVKADSAYRVVLAARPEQEGIHHNLGTVAFRAKDNRRALGYFRKEAELYPEPRPFHAMGLAFEKLSMADSARWAFEQAVAHDSTFAVGYASLSQWHATSGEFDQALDYAIKAHAASPRNRHYEAMKGRMLVRAGRTEDGIAILTPIVARDPLDYQSGFALGRAWQAEGNDEYARAYIDRAERSRETMQSIEAQMELLEDAPNNLQARLKLAESLRQVGRLEQSILQYQFAEARAPSSIAIKANLATLYMMTGDTTSAMDRFRQIIAQDSTVVEVWINLAQLYTRTGQAGEAEEALANAKRYGPDHPRVASLEAWMQAQQ